MKFCSRRWKFTDQEFGAKLITDVVVTYRFKRGIALSVGGNNIFDIYPDKVYVDPRNSLAAVYAVLLIFARILA